MVILNFLIITQVPHKVVGGKYYAYGPYVKEINIWGKFTNKITIVAPIHREIELDPIDTAYLQKNCRLVRVPNLKLTTFFSIFKSLILAPYVLLVIIKEISKSDHIHLRCPGNMGLLGVIAQLFFPNKKKTAKYAGNWDPKSSQPITYKLQRAILNNEFLTRKIKVLVYGKWSDSSSNIIPFFTASYFKSDFVPVKKVPLNEGGFIDLIFVGSLTHNKNPVASARILLSLRMAGINARITFCGNGNLIGDLMNFRQTHLLGKHMIIQGNVKAHELKELYIKSHFLILLSESEGWPKAVAEAMFFGCVPLTTPVSCVPEMLGHGDRGSLIYSGESSVLQTILGYLKSPDNYQLASSKAQNWSRLYTFEKFEEEIKNILFNE